MRLYTILWNIKVRTPNDNNKHLNKWNKHFIPTLRSMIRMTLDCVWLTQSSVIRIIPLNVGTKCFFSILPKCLFVIIVIHAYFIHISQDSVRHICSMVVYIIITLLHIVCRVCQWKNFENQSLIGKHMDKSKVPHFYGPPCTLIATHRNIRHNYDTIVYELQKKLPTTNLITAPLPECRY